MSIAVEYFTPAFDVIISPKCLNLCGVRECYEPESLFFAIAEVSFVDGAVMIVVDAFSVLLAFDPHAFIDISV